MDPGGAKESMVSLMKETVGSEVAVKASGGIRTKSDAEKFIQLGATRIGTSNGVSIVGTVDEPVETSGY